MFVVIRSRRQGPFEVCRTSPKSSKLQDKVVWGWGGCGMGWAAWRPFMWLGESNPRVSCAPRTAASKNASGSTRRGERFTLKRTLNERLFKILSIIWQRGLNTLHGGLGWLWRAETSGQPGSLQILQLTPSAKRSRPCDSEGLKTRVNTHRTSPMTQLNSVPQPRLSPLRPPRRPGVRLLSRTSQLPR